MRSGTITFEPELESLLQEVAADPESRLLSAQRKREYRALLSNPDPVSSKSDVLSKPEAYLLDFYREELAWLLVEACSVAFRSDSKFGQRFHRMRSDRAPQALPDEAQFKVRAEIVASNAPKSSALRILHSCLTTSSGAKASIRSIALASLEVAPCPEALCYQIHDMVNEGDLVLAEELCAVLLRRSITPAVRASALSAAGRIAFDRADYRAAARAHAAVLDADASRHSSIPLWLVNAALTGDRTEMTLAMSEANRFIDPGGPIVRQFRATFDSVRDKVGRAGIKALRSCSNLAAEQGETSAQVIHEAIG